MVGSSFAEQYLHALHLKHEKEKHERKLEEKHKKLEKIRHELRSGLDSFLKGRNAKVSELSRAFLKQAMVVDEEKQKLSILQSQLQVVKNAPFKNRPRLGIS